MQSSYRAGNQEQEASTLQRFIIMSLSLVQGSIVGVQSQESTENICSRLSGSAKTKKNKFYEMFWRWRRGSSDVTEDGGGMLRTICDVLFIALRVLRWKSCARNARGLVSVFSNSVMKKNPHLILCKLLRCRACEC